MTARLRYSPDNRWVLECVDMEAYDPVDGTRSFLDGTATVAVTARRKGGGTSIGGETWPLALAYRAASDGVFWTFLEDNLTVDPKVRYEILVAGDDGAGSSFSWVEPLEVIDPRRGGD